MARCRRAALLAPPAKELRTIGVEPWAAPAEPIPSPPCPALSHPSNAAAGPCRSSSPEYRAGGGCRPQRLASPDPSSGQSASQCAARRRRSGAGAALAAAAEQQHQHTCYTCLEGGVLSEGRHRITRLWGTQLPKCVQHTARAPYRGRQVPLLTCYGLHSIAQRQPHGCKNASLAREKRSLVTCITLKLHLNVRPRCAPAPGAGSRWSSSETAAASFRTFSGRSRSEADCRK